MIRMAKGIGYSALLPAAFLLCFSGCGAAPGTNAETSKRIEGENPPVVAVVRPETAHADQSLALPGTFEPYEKASLRAQVTGTIKQVYVDIGDEVQENQPLAEIIVPELPSDLKRAEALLRRAKVAADWARLRYDRIASLQKKEAGAVSEEDVELASAELDAASAEVEVAQAEVGALRARDSYTTVRSPFGGVIVRRSVDRGAHVVEGETDEDPIFELIRTDRLRLAFDIPESLSPFVGPGTGVSIVVDAFPSEEFTRPIARATGSLDRRTRSMHAEVDWTNDKTVVRPGMYARVNLPCRNIPGVLAVPSGALRTGNGSAVLFLVEESHIQSVPVTVLYDDGVRAVIRGPIDGDARIVKVASPGLQAGEKIEVRQDGEGS